ncbi:hypothetical protein SAVIM338S_00007 [Streptomyces avidinii]
MLTTDSMPFALVVQTGGEFVLTDWTPTTEAHELLQSEGIEQTGHLHPQKIDDTLTLWSNGNALWTHTPVNHTAERLFDISVTFCGPVVLTGAPDLCYANGLTQDQALELIERILSGKRVLTTRLHLHIPAQRTC